MADINTDPTLFNNSFQGLTSEIEYSNYFAPKNGERANETNIGKAPKRTKKELNILRDYMSILFNRPVRLWDPTITYSYGEIVAIETVSNVTAHFYNYYKSDINDNFNQNPTSTTGIWSEVDPMGRFLYTGGADNIYQNDVRIGENAHNSGYFIIGDRLGYNIAIDRNEIMARHYDVSNKLTNYSDLNLQSDGGNIYIHTNIQEPSINDDSGTTGFAFKNDGKFGLGTNYPSSTVHIKSLSPSLTLQDSTRTAIKLSTTISGTVTTINSEGQDLSIDTDNSIYLGSSNTNNIYINGKNAKTPSTIEVVGDMSIRHNTDNTSAVLQLTGVNGDDRVIIKPNSIQAKQASGVKVLSLQPTGGGICIHGDTTSTTDAVSISSNGSLVIGKNLCKGESMNDSNNKLEVHGDIFLSKGIKGLKDLVLGEDTGTVLSIARRSDNDFSLNTWTDKTKAIKDRLFIQDLGGDVVFNSDTGTSTIHITDDGKIGIGKLNPTTELDVTGNAKVSLNLSSKSINVDASLYINGDTLSCTTDAKTLYIQRAITGYSASGNVVFCADSDTDTNTVRISQTGKMSLGSAVAPSTDRLSVVGRLGLYSGDPSAASTNALVIDPSTDGNIKLTTLNKADISVFSGTDSFYSDLVLGAKTSQDTNVKNMSRLIIGGSSLSGFTIKPDGATSFTDVDNIANGSSMFKLEVHEPTVISYNQPTTNGDSQINFMYDTEVLRVRRTSEEYVRFGGDYIQGVKGVESSTDSQFSAARAASTLRLQPNGGKVQIGSTNTSETDVTLLTKGVVQATTFDGTATQALYADLAERYHADGVYEAGTIMCHGGVEEVTPGSSGNIVAGVISDAAAFRMNDLPEYRVDGKWPLLALKGRLPVKLTGNCTKGQFIVVDVNGMGKSVDKANISTYKNFEIVGVALCNSYEKDIVDVNGEPTGSIQKWTEVKV